MLGNTMHRAHGNQRGGTGPRLGLGQLGRGQAAGAGGRGPVLSLLIRRHEISRHGFLVVWEEGVQTMLER